MDATILVTISAIVRYLAEARKAEAKVKECNAQMKKAADELCAVWKGEAAEAFKAEQDGLNNWVTQLIGVGASYLANIDKAAKAYEETEKAVQSRWK